MVTFLTSKVTVSSISGSTITLKPPCFAKIWIKSFNGKSRCSKSILALWGAIVTSFTMLICPLYLVSFSAASAKAWGKNKANTGKAKLPKNNKLSTTANHPVGG